MLDIKSKGLDEAAAKMEFLKTLGSQVTGIALKGATRTGGVNSADIIEHLAEGNDRSSEWWSSRDIRPTERDSDEAAAEFMKIVEPRLEKMRSKNYITGAAGQEKAAFLMSKEAQSAATSAHGLGLRRAGKVIQAEMLRRAEAGLTVGTNGAERMADPVSPDYGKWRQRKFGIPENVVYKATGQLIADLNGPLVTHRQEDLSQLLKAIGLF